MDFKNKTGGYPSVDTMHTAILHMDARTSSPRSAESTNNTSIKLFLSPQLLSPHPEFSGPWGGELVVVLFWLPSLYQLACGKAWFCL